MSAPETAKQILCRAFFVSCLGGSDHEKKVVMLLDLALAADDLVLAHENALSVLVGSDPAMIDLAMEDQQRALREVVKCRNSLREAGILR